MAETTYTRQRERIEAYFDRTAAKAWEALTSDAPLGRVRATVRAGRDEMRSTLLSWLPQDLGDVSLLDAGCGTGALSIEAARRGATVLGVDVAASLVDIARTRATTLPARSRPVFTTGDMTDHGRRFDHVVAMDSVIHYDFDEMLAVLARLCAQADRSVAFTVAPYSALLGLMHTAGKCFPRGDRSPAIVPVRLPRLHERLGCDPRFEGWRLARAHRVHRGFYISHALELVR